MKTTIGKALRLKKTLSVGLSQIVNRINSNAVTYGEVKPDFAVVDQLKRHADEQAELRKIKMAVITKSVGITVHVSEDVLAPEAGTDIPVYQAILLRDDLKSRRSVLSSLINASTQSRTEYLAEKVVQVPAIRQFDFDATLQEVDQLQGMIDELDAAIQYVDATSTID